MKIREAAQHDVGRITEVLSEAFPSDAEAKLVELLRVNGNLTISLVSVHESEIVGYVAFSPVTLNGKGFGLGLAPVAVVPKYQSRGYGAKLVQAGLAAAESIGIGAVVVLGEPAYYSRFGFRAASEWNLKDEYGGGPAFQAIELLENFIPRGGGLVQYGAEFEGV